MNFPLSVRMRPRDLDEYFGQEEMIGERSLLKKAIDSDELFSMILYGPAGCGKTSLAHLIAGKTRSYFEELQAFESGKKEIREIIEKAKQRLREHNQRTILFVDEIHAFNKTQQDVLLKAVEQRDIVLIGATTENPFFEVNAPLISRSKIYSLKPLSEDHIKKLIISALSDRERGLGRLDLGIDDDAIDHLAKLSGGDARFALNTLEFAASLSATSAASLSAASSKASDTSSVIGRDDPADLNQETTSVITADLISEAAQKRPVKYDKDGDTHHDVISAFIKSMRGSDPDAAIYWLARMIYAGEDPKFIARRMVIFASEDVGLADPVALQTAVAAFRAVELIGLPEARINLAHAVIYLCLAPKSNSAYVAIDDALKFVATGPAGEVPPHLRSSGYGGAKSLGHGAGYKYPHDHEHGYVAQNYFPENWPKDQKKPVFYKGIDHGSEKELREDHARRKGKDHS